MNILVTGMSGLIGGLVRTRFESQAELSALNRRTVNGIPTTQADLADRYDVMFANSRNRWGYRDLLHTERAVGFVPRDAAEDHR